MRRTQIYLTEDEQTAIRQISLRTGASQSALIRSAIKRENAFGLWQDYAALPSLETRGAEERFIE